MIWLGERTYDLINSPYISLYSSEQLVNLGRHTMVTTHNSCPAGILLSNFYENYSNRRNKLTYYIQYSYGDLLLFVFGVSPQRIVAPNRVDNARWSLLLLFD